MSSGLVMMNSYQETETEKKLSCSVVYKNMLTRVFQVISQDKQKVNLYVQFYKLQSFFNPAPANLLSKYMRQQEK